MITTAADGLAVTAIGSSDAASTRNDQKTKPRRASRFITHTPKTAPANWNRFKVNPPVNASFSPKEDKTFGAKVNSAKKGSTWQNQNSDANRLRRRHRGVNSAASRTRPGRS